MAGPSTTLPVCAFRSHVSRSAVWAESPVHDENIATRPSGSLRHAVAPDALWKRAGAEPLPSRTGGRCEPTAAGRGHKRRGRLRTALMGHACGDCRVSCRRRTGCHLAVGRRPAGSTHRNRQQSPGDHHDRPDRSDRSDRSGDCDCRSPTAPGSARPHRGHRRHAGPWRCRWRCGNPFCPVRTRMSWRAL